MVSRSGSCGSSRPPYSIVTVISVSCSSVTGRLTRIVFWFDTRRLNSRPNWSLTTDRTTSESARRMVSCPRLGARTRSRIVALPSIH